MSSVLDKFGRPLRDLRISVTDRCNFRCPYCMPREVFGENFPFLPRSEVLTFEEITRLAAAMTGLGVRKIRLTGGEPLLRRDLSSLVTMLADIEGLEDIALTTNGLLLESAARALQAAGLHRVTVSLDALDDALFRRLGGTDRPVADVLRGIRAAADAGLPLKINCVVQHGVNETEVLPLASWCRSEGYTLRFIEYMDVGNHNGWRHESVVSAEVLRSRLHEAFGLVPLEPAWRGEVARRYRYADGGGEVGFISSITAPFCGDCNRARLTADGKLVSCLFAFGGTDLRALLRSGGSDEQLSDCIRSLWQAREDRYSDLRVANQTLQPKVEMSYVGG
ncbi:MAG: GTP 3',8-cyclase MoaA [Chthoniobacterales bacterium]